MSNEQQEADYDLICLGAGIGGLTAAIAAHELGLRPLLIEKTDKLGGVAGISGGQCWVPANHVARREGIADSSDSALAYMIWAGGGFGDERLARHYCIRASEVVQFLEEKAGVRWVIVPVPDPFAGAEGSEGRALEKGRLLEVDVFAGSSLGSARTGTRKERSITTAAERFSGRVPGTDELRERQSRDDRAHGGALAGALVKNALDRDIEIWTQAQPTALLCDNGAVYGARVMRESGEVVVRSRHGVLLATGGYDSSEEYTRAFEGRAVSTTALTSVTGDHLRLAGMLGAKLTAPFRPVHTFLDPDVPVIRDDDRTVQRDDTIVRAGFPHAMIVNKRGRRFHDESQYQSRDAGLSAIDPRAPWSLANVPCWAIWDARHVERYFGGVASQSHAVLSAQSIEELATAAGISAAGLQDEIKRFNSYSRSGEDADFGRGSRRSSHFFGDFAGTGHPNLGPIETPPFYAVRLVIRSMGIGVAGLSVDEHARVIDWNNQPIPGLYAAGNSVAMAELGFAYTGGNANTRGMLHGFCAAEHAAERASLARQDAQ